MLSLAIDHAMFARSCAVNCYIRARAAEAIASISGMFVNTRAAQDHAVFDSCCGVKLRIRSSAEAAIACNKGLSS